MTQKPELPEPCRFCPISEVTNVVTALEEKHCCGALSINAIFRSHFGITSELVIYDCLFSFFELLGVVSPSEELEELVFTLQ